MCSASRSTVLYCSVLKSSVKRAEPTDRHIVMSTTVLALLPPILVIIVMQKSFVKGLTDTEK